RGVAGEVERAHRVGGVVDVGRVQTRLAPGEQDPWLLRWFDRIRWYPVSAEELLDLRADTAAGRGALRAEDGEFRLAEYRRFLADNADSIGEFRARQAEAFAAERQSWQSSGELSGDQ